MDDPASSVTTVIFRPAFAHVAAAAQPAGPDPITITSFTGIYAMTSQRALPDLTVAIASCGEPAAFSATWHTYIFVTSTLRRPNPSQLNFFPFTSTMTKR